MQQYISTGKLNIKIYIFYLQRNGNWESTFSQALYQKLKPPSLELPSLLSDYFAVHVCMFLWNRINPILQHSALTSLHINQLKWTSQQAFKYIISVYLSKIKFPCGFNVINTFLVSNGSCIITFTQCVYAGLRALDALSVYIIINSC